MTLFNRILKFKKHLLSLILLTLIVGVGVFGFGERVGAENPVAKTITGMFIDFSSTAIWGLVGWLAQLIVAFLGRVLIAVIQIMLAVSQYNDFLSATAVTKGWVIIRDIANMGFIVVLLIIAFSTVLGIEQYSYKKMLPKLLIMAVLINFSKMICGFFIDFAQVIMMTFVNGFSTAAAGNLTTSFGLDQLLALRGNIEATGGEVSEFEVILAYLLAICMLVVALVVTAIIALVYIARIIALWILIVISPIAFLCHATPGGEKYSSQWWQAFGKYLITGPVLAFFLWLAFTIMAANPMTRDESGRLLDDGSGLSREFFSREMIKGEKGGEPEDIFYKAGKGLGKDVGDTVYLTISGMGSSDRILSFIIAIAMLIAALMMTQSLGVAGGKLAGTAVGGMQGWLAGGMQGWLAGKVGPSPMRWARERWGAYRAKREGIRKEAVGRFGEMVSIAQDRLAMLPGMRHIRPGTAREAETRRREYQKSQIERAAKIFNVAGMDENRLWREVNTTRNRELRVAIAQELQSRRMLNIDREGEERGDQAVIARNQEVVRIVNQTRRDLNNIPEVRGTFEDVIKKSSPELAARTIYNEFRQDIDQQRFWRDGDLGKVDAVNALSTLGDRMVDALNTRMGGGGALTQRIIRQAKDAKELENWYQSFSQDRRNRIFDPLQNTDLRNRAEREKLALATGRYHQIWDMNSIQHQGEYRDFVENNQSKVEMNVDVEVLRNAEFLDILQGILGRSGIEKVVKRNRASRQAFSDGERRLVNEYNRVGDYASSGARTARSLNIAFSTNDNRVEESYDHTNPLAEIALTEDIAAKRIRGKDLTNLEARNISPENIQNIVSGISTSEIKAIFEEGREDLMEQIRTTLRSQAAGRPGSRADNMLNTLINNSEWFNR